MPVPSRPTRLNRLYRLFKPSERFRTRLAAVTALGAGLVVVAATAVPSGAAPSPGGDRAEAGRHFDALVFTRTTGFRHDSIPAGIAAIEQLGQRHDFSVDATEDAGHLQRRRPRASTRSSSGSPRPVTCSTRAAGGVRALHRRRRRLRRHPRGVRHGVRLGVVRRPRRRVLQRAPRSAGALVNVAGKGNISTSAAAAPLVALRRVVQLRPQPARRRASPRHAGREDLRSRTTPGWATTTPSPGATSTREAAPGTPGWATRRPPTPSASSSRHVLGGIQQTAGVARFNCGAD